MVSKNAIIYFIVLLLILTLLLIVLFSTTDFDSLLGMKRLAIKVGETAINTNDFATIKSISGAKAQAMTPSDFANNFVDTLLLSEEGKRLGLDKTPKFIKKISEFDRLLVINSDTDKISKSVFLIEELAKATRERIIEKLPMISSETLGINDTSNFKPKLRLKTILVKTMSQALNVLKEASSGKSFKSLNASWSVSLYRFVGGDLGWREANDFPDGLYEKLSSLPVASLTIGMEDEYGVHIFSSASKQKNFTKLNQSSTVLRAIAARKAKSIETTIVHLKKTMNCYICPGLRSACNMPTN